MSVTLCLSSMCNLLGVAVYYTGINKVKGKVPRCGKFDPKTVNKYNLCYQCDVDGTDSFFGILVLELKETNHNCMCNFYLKTCKDRF